MRRGNVALLVLTALIFAICGRVIYTHLLNQNADTVSLRSLPSDRASNQSYSVGDKNEVRSPTSEALLEEKPELKVLKRLQVGSNADVNFYGKLIDQYEQPVSNAEIDYSIPHYEVDILPAANRSEGRGTVASDANGVFKIENAEGMYFTVRVIRKAGYAFKDRNRTFIYTPRTTDQVVHQPDSESPVIFYGWRKEEAARELKEDEGRKTVPANGVFRSLILPGSDEPLLIAFQNIGESLEMDGTPQWRGQLRIENGGLIESNDTFMYEAPGTGYEPEWEVVAGENETVEKRFYIKMYNVYGRLDIKLIGYYGNDSESKKRGYIRYRYVLNPTGSRNLLPANE